MVSTFCFLTVALQIPSTGGLYLAKSPTSGVKYRLTNKENWSVWTLETAHTYNMASPSKLKAALKVGVLDSVLHDSLGDRLREIPTMPSTPFPEVISCWIWLKEVLTTLDELGYIKLIDSVGAIEKEASRLARMAVGWCSRVISKSAGTEA